MQSNLLTAGEFASLAGTTKRTVLWYEEEGILEPKEVDSENGYRRYEPNQIIDFQAILLLRKLNFSIAEIQKFLAKNNSLEKLFNLKKKSLLEEITQLQIALQDTDKYYHNLQKTGTLADPKVRMFKPTTVYYIDKLGPYRDIGDYFEELRSYFKIVPGRTLGLVIYEQRGYRPKKSKVKVCFLVKPGLVLKSGAENLVKKMVVPGFKALSYTHFGSSNLLSMLWKQLEKYQAKKGYKHNRSLPFEDLELSESEHKTEMLMPII